nr:hypothetical protein [uncultured Trichococcus sp.]
MIIKDFDLDDVFLMSEIIEKMELEMDTDAIIKKTKIAKMTGKKDASALGKDVLMSLGIDLSTKLIRKLHKAKREVKQLISNLTGLELENVGKMSMKDMKGFFMELVQREGFEDFLSQAGEATE